MDGPDSPPTLLFTPLSHYASAASASAMKQSSGRANGGEEDDLLLSKRPRACMRQTASMREFAALTEGAPRSSDQAGADRHVLHLLQEHSGGSVGGGRTSADDWLQSGYYLGAVAPRASSFGRRRNSADFVVVETAHFLRTCGLCKRRLGPGRDTFMYRGDIAFCSLECRQQHMNQEDLKEKCSMTSRKDTSPSSNSSEKSDTGEAVSAA